MPTLELKVHSAIDKQVNRVAINVRLRLIEDISIIRNKNIRTRAETWARSVIIVSDFEDLKFVEDIVKKCTISFCNLYHAVNARPSIDARDQKKDSQENAKKNSKEQTQQKVVESN